VYALTFISNSRISRNFVTNC